MGRVVSERLAHLRQLHQQATEPPWTRTPPEANDVPDRGMVYTPSEGYIYVHGGPNRFWEMDDEGADLIAAMRNALPHLLDIAEAAESFAMRAKRDEPGNRWLEIEEALDRLEQQQ